MDYAELMIQQIETERKLYEALKQNRELLDIAKQQSDALVRLAQLLVVKG